MSKTKLKAVQDVQDVQDVGVDDNYEVTTEEFEDIGAFMRIAGKLSAGEPGSTSPVGLATRLVVSELGVALQLERVMKGTMDVARAMLSREIDDCFPEEREVGKREKEETA
jgi:hypothetical protein